MSESGGEPQEVDQLAKLIRKRAVIKGQLTQFENFLKNYTEDKQAQLTPRIEKCKELWLSFSYVQDEIEELTILSDLGAQDLERQEFTENYFAILADAEQKFKNDNVNVSVGQQRITNAGDANVKLPIMEIPNFFGSYADWLEFSDTFKGVIHSNTSLSKIQKFYYLKNTVKGDAAEVIRSLEISEDNYDEAWNLLSCRYENKKVIALSHIDSLYSFPKINRESSVHLRKFLDTIRKNLRALKTLKTDVENWDTLSIYLLEMKLDGDTKREWQKTQSSDKFSLMEEFLQFLENRCRLLETISGVNTGLKNLVFDKAKSEKTKSFVSTKGSCILCGGPHLLFSCKRFLDLPVASRRDQVRKLNVCWNCLRQGHFAQHCDFGPCKHCGRRHNSLLHESKLGMNHDSGKGSLGDSESGKNPKITNSNTKDYMHKTSRSFEHSKDQSTSGQIRGNVAVKSDLQSFQDTNLGSEDRVSHGFYGYGRINHGMSNEILLSTALIYLEGSSGKRFEGRALLDSGSQSNFISREFAKKIGLPAQNVKISVKGIGSEVTNVSEVLHTVVFSRVNNFRFTVSFLVVNEISENIPTDNVSTIDLKIPDNLVLADPNFGVSRKINVILGAAIFWDLLSVGQIKLRNSGIVLQKSKLGWVATGEVASYQAAFYTGRISHGLCNFSSLSLSDQLEKFWVIEDCVSQDKLSKEGKECETIFLNTLERSDDGRFVVSLPLRDGIGKLGNSYSMSYKRFLQLERKLAKNDQMRKEYHEFMQEYIDLGHMEKVTEDQCLENTPMTYYLPHHGVFKESSITTKCRVVFDGSAATDTGFSLNDFLMVGPKLQDNLFDILIRFRKYTVVISADIAKMYRQIWVKRDHRDLQRILWRFSRELPIDTFHLNTVTYGTSCAAYLAIRSLQQVGLDNLAKFPMASKIILKNFYVDDLLAGGDSVEEVKKLKSDLSEILGSVGFVLRKWLSNYNEVLTGESKDSVDIDHYLAEESITSTLGIMWDSSADELHYNINTNRFNTRVTKRNILSAIAHIFDPMGLVGPVVIRAKLIMQMLWRINLSWDESVPPDIHTSWIKFKDQIHDLKKIVIGRRIICSNPKRVELHCFTDASELAYGAAIYIRSTDSNNKHHVRLLCAKSRVAPLKVISLPRLELCGALLGAKLAREVKLALDVSSDDVVQFWCDSTIALAWISANSKQWQTFVANRVSEIQKLTVGCKWRHVDSSHNPADLISRGLEPSKLRYCKIWWEGPEWLKLEEACWPNSGFSVEEEEDPPEKRVIKKIFNFHIPTVNIIERYSNFNKLRRVVAYCIRFVRNCSMPIKDRALGHLSSDELIRSTKILIKLVQEREFFAEYQNLKQFKTISNNSKLISLNPFIDNEGVLRVGGRLDKAKISYSQKHPMILPSNHHLTELIIMHEHLKNLHAGPQALLAVIRLQYWPLQGKRALSRILRRCIVCFRVRPKSHQHLMGQLPQERVNPCKPFSNIGVDYCGPFEIKIGGLKGERFMKAYICIFICLSIKAVHLELVNDLSTQSFLNCFKRFLSRRGLCQNIFSDNGSNFVGAHNELKDLYAFLREPKNQSKFTEYFANIHINWKFIPPKSPHFGGIWEAAVRSVKFHLKRVIGNERLHYDEFCTIITQIESCLNSRPLCPLSENPEDLNVLTPGHFLVGAALKSLPQEDLRQYKSGRLKRYQHLTQLIQHFWDKWSRDYLQHLQQRNKWRVSTASLKPGDVVILKEDNLPPLKWQIGRIEEVHRGSDEVVRVVLVRTANGLYKRASTKVCLLPIEDNGF